ncbi:hypothetical protein B0H63DRAFT_516086 [Podospora didyma]|uniref:Uncharacterized protein n=1 Tax=Podospora didyma TaxID=330526 RepID=A0AAE0P450_9PEZI|nr:hypothetical protein B0H63DRAFT_516086 [Podospora didyma]
MTSFANPLFCGSSSTHGLTSLGFAGPAPPLPSPGYPYGYPVTDNGCSQGSVSLGLARHHTPTPFRPRQTPFLYSPQPEATDGQSGLIERPCLAPHRRGILPLKGCLKKSAASESSSSGRRVVFFPSTSGDASDPQTRDIITGEECTPHARTRLEWKADSAARKPPAPAPSPEAVVAVRPPPVSRKREPVWPFLEDQTMKGISPEEIGPELAQAIAEEEELDRRYTIAVMHSRLNARATSRCADKLHRHLHPEVLWSKFRRHREQQARVHLAKVADLIDQFANLSLDDSDIIY